MKSRTEREGVLGIIVAALLLIVLYRLFNPTAYTLPLLIIFAALTGLFLFDLFVVRRLNPHEINLTQKKSYSITWRSVLATTVLAGGATFALFLFAFLVLDQVASFAGYTPFSVELLQEAVRRITGFTTLTALRLGTAYIGLSFLLGTGFWLLYPYIPVEDEELAAPVSFLITWSYLLLVGGLLVGTSGFPTTSGLIIDAAVIAVWGKFFAVMYEGVQAYVP